MSQMMWTSAKRQDRAVSVSFAWGAPALRCESDGWEVLARLGSVVVRRWVADGGYGLRWAGTSWAPFAERLEVGCKVSRDKDVRKMKEMT
jgi:hypothetical protein